MERLRSWVAENVSFADEAIVEYIAGLCFDETLDDEEIVEAVQGIFVAENANADEFIPLLLKEAEKAWKADKESKEVEEQEQLQKRKAAAAAAALFDVTEDPPQSETPKKSGSQGLSKAELKARQQLLDKYGFEGDEIVEDENGETEIVYRASGSEKSSGLEKNRNADIVKSIEQAKREKSASEHAKQVQRNKELVEKQKLDKEKEKRRTQKREKRRM